MKKTTTIIFSLLLFLLTLATTPVQADSRQVIYFKETTCLVCAELQGYLNGPSNAYTEEEDYIKKMTDQGITVIIYDIMENPVIDAYGYTDTDGNQVDVTAIDVFAAFNDTYNRSRSDVPVIFAGDSYVDGLSNIQNAINSNTIFDLSDDPFLEVSVQEGQAYSDLTGIIGFFIVIGAGLLDGFNPCAIALLLLFISLLGFSNDKKVLILVEPIKEATLGIIEFFLS